MLEFYFEGGPDGPNWAPDKRFDLLTYHLLVVIWDKCPVSHAVSFWLEHPGLLCLSLLLPLMLHQLDWRRLRGAAQAVQ